MTNKKKNTDLIFENVCALAIKTNHKMYESFVGNFKSVFSGEGLDYKESKVFSDGDNVKHIDWKTSAKTGKLFVKKFEESRKLKINIILDFGISMEAGFQDVKKNKMIEAASIIIFSAMKTGDRISLKILGEEDANISGSGFGSGKNFSYQALEKMISEEISEKKIDYKNFFEKIYLNKKNNNSLFFIFSDFSDEKGENILKEIKKINTKKNGGNDVICVFIRDNLDLISQNPDAQDGFSEFENPENGEKILIDWKKFSEFKNVLDENYLEKRKSLAKFGIESLEIFEEKNIMDDFLEFFKMKEGKK